MTINDEHLTINKIYMNAERLKSIIAFMDVTERMKIIYRTVKVSTLDRGESDAEHSWHLALLLMLLEKELPAEINILKLYKMLLIHDLVEVYAGDTSVYDTVGRLDKAEREAKAAETLFSQLPSDLKEEFFALFHEFEARETLEANIAKALDKLHPLMQNLSSEGTDYLEFSATYEDEKQRIKPYVDFHPTLAQMATVLLDEAKSRGYIE